MTQFKDKARKGGAEAASAGLYDYPVLQAADVLLYNAHLVPVGEDQRQHLELMRTLARRFNGLYGETFVVPEMFVPPAGARVMALDEPTAKMSKSSPTPASYVAILDEPTWCGARSGAQRPTPDGDNRLPGQARHNEPPRHLRRRHWPRRPELERSTGQGLRRPQKDLGEVVVETLAPIRERALELLDDPKGLDDLLDAGAEKARGVARSTLHDAWRRWASTSGMQRLRATLDRIDRKGYGAYKDLSGSYDLGPFTLFVDRVQRDPFAPPSLVRVRTGRTSSNPRCSKTRRAGSPSKTS
jgi:tryptophanyl-tRNA synthetase